MNQHFQKTSRIDELIESGADSEVVERFVYTLEEEFLESATACVQEGSYALAISEYFMALLLPERTSTREKIFARAVRAFMLSGKDGAEFQREGILADPRFDRLAAELLGRVEEERHKHFDEQFAELDGRASLRAKDFAALEEVLGKMGSSIPTRYLVARLRLAREKKAQEFFNHIIERFDGLAEEENFQSFREHLANDISDLRKRAVVFSTGIHPVYGEQIREYISRAEELFTRSHTEKIIDDLYSSRSKILQDEFTEFKGIVKPDVDPVEILRGIVKALRIFRDEPLFTEIQRVGTQWAQSEGELRYRLLAVEQPEVALDLVARSLEIIDTYDGILPAEISSDFKGFLASLQEELSPRVMPSVRFDPPVAPPLVQENPGCLTRLLAWLPGGKQLMKTLLVKIILLFSVVLLSSANEVWAQADVVIAVDLSGTMEVNDPGRLRYYGADQFLSMLSYYGRKGNRAGVVKFGNGAEKLMEFGYVSRDKAGKYQGLFSDLASEDWTELGQGLQLSVGMLAEDQSGDKSIILISDGYIEGNPGVRRLSQNDARAAAERELWESFVPDLKRRRVKVYTIGLFKADARGRHLMERLANETGGFFKEVADPKEFYTIYKQILDSIEPPSGVTAIKGENNRFPLTPADYGVIITGQGDFSVRSPNGTMYPTKGGTASSTVRDQLVRYPDGGAVLFLGQPPTSEQQLSDDWTGEWAVDMRGEGEATYLSNVRLLRSGSSQSRQGFFKNEYVPINYVLDVRSDIDTHTRTFLEQCKTEYTIVRTDQQTGWSRSGILKGEDFAYAASDLLDQPGKFLLEVQMSCRKVNYRKVHQSFDVVDTELMKLMILHGPQRKQLQGQTLDEGEEIRIEGQDSIAQIAQQFPEYLGLKDKKLHIEMRYNNEPPQEAEINPLPDGGLVSEDRELEESGSLAINAELTGTLIVRRPDGQGMIYYPVRAKGSKTIQIRRPWSATLESTSWWLSVIISPLLGAFVFFRQKQWRSMGNMSLEGAGGLSRSFEDVDLSLKERLRRAFVLRGGPHISIGGPGSNADVTLPRGPKNIIAEIGKDLFNNFYIIQKGITPIHLNSTNDPIDPEVRQRINPNDRIVIDGTKVTFKPTFGDEGV